MKTALSRGVLIVCSIAALAAALQCGRAGDADRTRPAKLTFVFPVVSVTQYHPFYIARELGLFEDEGVEVEFVTAGGSSAAIQQVLGGNADAALPSPGAALNAAARGQDVRWIFSYQYSNIFTLVAPSGSGIAAVADLRGRQVGVSELSGGEVPLVRAMLRNAGLEEGVDVRIVPVGEGAALTVNALRTHQVDAYSSNLFDVAALKARGVPLDVIMPGYVQQYPSNGIVTTSRTLREKRPQLLALARAVAKAIVFAEANDEAAFRMATRIAPAEFEDAALSRAAWEAARTLRTPPAAITGQPIGSHFRAGFQAYHDFLARGNEDEGALPRAVDLDAVLDSSLLADANAWDKDAVRRRAAGR